MSLQRLPILGDPLSVNEPVEVLIRRSASQHFIPGSAVSSLWIVRSLTDGPSICRKLIPGHSPDRG